MGKIGGSGVTARPDFEWFVPRVQFAENCRARRNAMRVGWALVQGRAPAAWPVTDRCCARFVSFRSLWNPIPPSANPRRWWSRD